MSEVRVQREGELWAVQPSGSGNTFVTASAAIPFLVGYIRSFSWESAANLVSVDNRGTPQHTKVLEANPIDVSFEFLSTAGGLMSAISGTGASVPMYHFEHVQRRPERGLASGVFHQFLGTVIMDSTYDERKEGNAISIKARALAMTGPTASGYLPQATSFFI